MKNTFSILAFAGIIATALPVVAQHEHHPEPARDTTKHEMHHMQEHEMKGHNLEKHEMQGMEHKEEMQHAIHMTHNFSLSLPMNRNGSGTGWQPDATPMYAYMKHKNQWNFMLHGSLFVRYTSQNFNNKNKRGSDSKLSFPNWVMGMAQRQVGENGLLAIRGMVSLDRLTDGGAGYPLLFQSGETWNGNPLIDRQHPHDLISELSVGYTQRINDKLDLTVYAGYPGEPALGPTAFMHRMSAFNNPDAVLGHHWQDATHITFGVVTAGVRYGKFKLEGSGFTGREPNENRFNFDKPRFDSYSYRLLFNPSSNWALQVSRGFIKSPEAGHHDENVNRTTASVQHSKSFNTKNRWISSSLVYGLNDSGKNHRENSLLAESNLQWDKWAFYGRYEWIQKSAEELGLVWYDEVPKDKFPVSAFTLGLNRQLFSFSNTLLQAGIQASFYAIDKNLQPVYGRSPVSGQVYLRFTPAIMRM
ncbi:hypothetical protein [Dyadobacter sp. NIV53]|uniref:hypothetical protein n=1 Tax=Dyadobacter sp. NIV53 TaxID=2861765 RepID=UPI001C88B3A3|nr:hypothetical protein [Dyadobacter sp. NIV53]